MTRDEQQALIHKTAADLWEQFDEDDRRLVRFGMFPSGPMQEAVQVLSDVEDATRLLACALMDRARADLRTRATTKQTYRPFTKTEGA